MNTLLSINEIVAKLWSSKVKKINAELNSLSSLIKITPHDDVLSYLSLLPANDVKVHGVRFMCFQSMILENTELIPGCYINPFDFLVFASLHSGEVFAVEILTGGVYLISAEKYESPDLISPGWNDEHTDFLPDIPISTETIKETSLVSFDSMKQFLLKSLTDHRN